MVIPQVVFAPTSLMVNHFCYETLSCLIGKKQDLGFSSEYWNNFSAHVRQMGQTVITGFNGLITRFDRLTKVFIHNYIIGILLRLFLLYKCHD